LRGAPTNFTEERSVSESEWNKKNLALLLKLAGDTRQYGGLILGSCTHVVVNS
jgi:hypothetical protein